MDTITKIKQRIELNSFDFDARRQIGLILMNKDPLSAVKHFFFNVTHIPDRDRIYLDSVLLALTLKNTEPDFAFNVINWAFLNKKTLKNAYLTNKGDYIGHISDQAHEFISQYSFNQTKSYIAGLNGPTAEKSRLLSFYEGFYGLKPISYNCEHQQPSYQFYPKLTSQPFYSADDFEWAALFKRNNDKIVSEILSLIENTQQLTPYVEQSTGVEGLDELKNSSKWSSLHFLKGGVKNKAICDSCPTINMVLANLPLPYMQGHSPEAFVSILAGGAHIKPHVGLSNLKLTVHFPISLPSKCAISVGNETKAWREGRLLIFDDSFIHEAWNHSKQDRIMLIFEIWHPDLTEFEQLTLSQLMSMQDESINNAEQFNFQQLEQTVLPLLCNKL